MTDLQASSASDAGPPKLERADIGEAKGEEGDNGGQRGAAAERPPFGSPPAVTSATDSEADNRPKPPPTTQLPSLPAQKSSPLEPKLFTPADKFDDGK